MKRAIILFILSAIVRILHAQDGGLLHKGTSFYYNAKYDSALVCLNKVLEKDELSFSKTTEVLLLRSLVLCNLSFFEEAMDDAIQAYDICKKQHIDSLAAQSLLAIGKVNYTMYNDSVAETYMLSAKNIAEKQKNNKAIMQVENALAQLYMVNENNEKGLSLAASSLQRAQAEQDTLYMVLNLNLYASYYTNLNRWGEEINPEYQSKTKEYLDEAARLSVEKNIPMLLIGTYMRYVRYYRVEKNYPEALAYAEKVIDICDPKNYPTLVQVYDHLVGIYAHLGDTRKVIDNHQKFYTLMKQQSEYQLHHATQELNVKYRTAEKELQINRQKTERTVLLLILGVVASLLLLLRYFLYLRNKRMRELKELNQTKDRFFSIISHDLKNPAIAQHEALQQLATYGNRWNDNLRQEYFDKLLESADGQTQLLYNLLNWAQVQTGRMPCTPVKFDLITTLSSDLSLIKNMAERKGIEFSVESPETAQVFGDANMLAAVVRNLLINAVKFTAAGGRVCLKVTPTEDKTGYSVSVHDTGEGMSAEQIDELLKSDTKQSNPGTPGEKGSGLGLVICRELLERNGSTLDVHSAAGEGTTIRFWLKV